MADPIEKDQASSLFMNACRMEGVTDNLDDLSFSQLLWLFRGAGRLRNEIRYAIDNIEIKEEDHEPNETGEDAE